MGFGPAHRFAGTTNRRKRIEPEDIRLGRGSPRGTTARVTLSGDFFSEVCQ